ncbi:MAG TPA: magnesium transporter CorA family protein [Candidatus Saccharimonadia bacterium]|nr:magnesium transporter CorA family protein [Candidatus Saccharimonadia bacterium]
MLTYCYRSVREDKLAKADVFRPGSLILAEGPTPDELKLLEAKFKLDPDLLTDALDPDEIPRIETDDDMLYVYMRYSYRRGDVVDTDPVLLVVSSNFVALVSRRPLPGLDRLLGSPTLITTQRAKVLLLLLRSLVLSYESNVNFLDRQIRGVRAKLSVEKISNRDFVAFVVIEDSLGSFLSDLVAANVVLQGLLSGRYGLVFHEEDKDLVEDLSQATRQLIESSRSSMQTIVNIREAYSTIMANNLNRIIKRLTVITIFMSIPTIVSSIYGMNVALPGQHNSGMFWVLGAVVIGAIGLLGWIFWRENWF